jgi:8-oxo-dGTP diphosphatase
MADSVYQTFGNKVRIRVCGICQIQNSLLLVNHSGIRPGDFWAPPGGGIEFGESMENCLKREFIEETGLQIEVGEIAFTCEYVHPPLHAIEIFFRVNVAGGILSTGIDPEMHDNQIIKDVRFLTWTEIDSLNRESRHGIFNLLDNSSKIVDLKGHFKL